MKTWTLPQIRGTGKKACKRPKRVLVIDQSSDGRLAVAEWLRHAQDLVLCGEADSSAGALRAAAQLNPDMVVTEVLSPEDFAHIRSLRERYPHLPILVFSFEDEECYAPLVLEAGADGYLSKRADACTFLAAVRAALEGRIVLSRPMRARLLAKCWADCVPAAALNVGKAMVEVSGRLGAQIPTPQVLQVQWHRSLPLPCGIDVAATGIWA